MSLSFNLWVYSKTAETDVLPAVWVYKSSACRDHRFPAAPTYINVIHTLRATLAHIKEQTHTDITTDVHGHRLAYHVAFGRFLFLVRDCRTLWLHCCVMLAATLLALDILWRHFSLKLPCIKGFGDYALYKSTFYLLTYWLTCCVHVTMSQPRWLSCIGCQSWHVYSSSCASWSTSPSSAMPRHTSQSFCSQSSHSYPVELFGVRPQGRTFKFRELAWSLESAPSASQLQSRGTTCHCTSA